MNHHFVQINAPDVYCLSGDRVGAFFDTFALTSVFKTPPPPPPPTSPLNITTHYDKTTLIALVVLPLLCPHVYFVSLRVFVVTLKSLNLFLNFKLDCWLRCIDLSCIASCNVFSKIFT